MARRNRMLGQAAAGDLNPMWGAVASGTVSAGTAVGVRKFSKSLSMMNNAELVGMGAGVAVGALMMISAKSRAAGFVGIVTSLITSGLRYVEQSGMLGGSLGAVSAERIQALGMATAQRMPLAAASAQSVPTLGIVSPEVVPTLGGAPVTFQGGSPVTFQGLAGAFGATIYGGN